MTAVALPLPFLVPMLQLLWYRAQLHLLDDGATHPVVSAGTPLCDHRWNRAWQAVARAGKAAAQVLYRTLSAHGRRCPLYVFGARQRMRACEWRFFSFRLLFHIKCMLLRSTIVWPTVLRLSCNPPVERVRLLCSAVRTGLHTASICYDDICGIHHLPARSLRFNEYDALCDVALG